jgi:hypothetical protein
MAYSDLVVFQISEILQADGVGTFATDIFVSKEPESPDNCITIYKTGGLPDNCLTVGNRTQEVHNFQVRVRNNNYLTGHTIMESVRTSIEKGIKTLVDSGGTNYFKIELSSLPFDLQRDTKNRAIIVANFSCMRSYS